MNSDFFLPDSKYRIEIQKVAEEAIRKNFVCGIYSEKDEIIRIVNFIFNFHYDQICNIIKGVDSKNIVSFLLFQYQLIEDSILLKNKDINTVLYKETIFFLLDLIAEKKKYESSCAIYFHEYEFLHKLWIHAEKAIEYSNVSNLSHRICQETTQVEILPENSQYFLEHTLSDNFDKHFKKFQEDVQANIGLRENHLIGDDLQNKILALVQDDHNTGFKEEFGLTYLEFEFIILDIVRNCKEIGNPEQIPCISDSHILNISEQLNVPLKNIIRLLSGISLGKKQFKTRKREIWDYVQQERSKKRPLIQINYDGKDWLLFSPYMLGNRICGLAEDLALSPQNRIPKEWNSKNINKKFSLINTELGEWFEFKTTKLLETVGIIGYKPGRKLKLDNNKTFQIDSKIGPADFIGYSESLNAIVLIECKLLDCVFEPKGIHGELSKFLYNKSCFVDKFNDKINWTIENFEKVKSAIEFQCKIKIPKYCNIVNYCFVTYYPTMVRYFYKKIPSPTLFELLKLCKGQNKWPFETGCAKISNETPTPYIEANKQNIEKHRHTYRKRQSIVEHPYGTIKRQWGFNYISTKKGKKRASADVGFVFIAHNIRRIMNIIGKNALKKYLEVLILSISGIYRPIRFKLNPFKAINFLNKILTYYFEGCLNRLKFDQNLLIMEGF